MYTSPTINCCVVLYRMKLFYVLEECFEAAAAVIILIDYFIPGSCFAKFEKTKDFVSKRVITLFSKYQQVYEGLNDGIKMVGNFHTHTDTRAESLSSDNVPTDMCVRTSLTKVL